MKRGAPLRRTPMPRRKSTLQPKKPIGRNGGRSRPKPVPTPDMKSDAELWQERRHALYVRSGGRCEVGGCDLNRTGMEAHHRKLRSRGGGHELSNLIAACPRCHHEKVHAHPEWATRAGFMVATPVDPASWAVTLNDGRVVRLTDDGGYDLVFPPNPGETA